MMTESAVVIDYKSGKKTGIATVQCQSQSACVTCAAKSACGASVLSELTGKLASHVFQVETITPLKVGQRVEIGLQEKSLLFSAFLLYMIPLLVILASTFASEYIFSTELTRVIFIFFCTALSFLIVRHYAKRIQKKSAFQPILLRVL